MEQQIQVVEAVVQEALQDVTSGGAWRFRHSNNKV